MENEQKDPGKTPEQQALSELANALALVIDAIGNGELSRVFKTIAGELTRPQFSILDVADIIQKLKQNDDL